MKHSVTFVVEPTDESAPINLNELIEVLRDVIRRDFKYKIHSTQSVPLHQNLKGIHDK